MKSKEQKKKDLTALTEELGNSKSAMVVGFNKVTVAKDQEFRSQLRTAGAKFQVVKNTIARLAVKDSAYSEIKGDFKGMSAIAWTDSDPVVLSKAVSKFVKDNKDFYSFKTGIVEGRVVDFSQVESIASLPSKEELIAKLLFVLNAPAQQIASVINAVPRNLAIVVKQIGEQAPESRSGATATEAKTAEVPAAAEETATAETTGTATEEAASEETPAAEAETSTEEAAPEATTEETVQAETPAEETAPEAEAEATEEKPE